MKKKKEGAVSLSLSLSLSSSKSCWRICKFLKETRREETRENYLMNILNSLRGWSPPRGRPHLYQKPVFLLAPRPRGRMDTPHVDGGSLADGTSGTSRVSFLRVRRAPIFSKSGICVWWLMDRLVSTSCVTVWDLWRLWERGREGGRERGREGGREREGEGEGERDCPIIITKTILFSPSLSALLLLSHTHTKWLIIIFSLCKFYTFNT